MRQPNPKTSTMADEILDPPGSIGIIGGDLPGLEAALYARFLGYEVQLFEAQEIGWNWLQRGATPLPCLPGHGISELALQAIQTQGDRHESPQALPTTCGGWAVEVLQPLAQVDLLAQRVHANHRVTEVRRVPNAEDTSELDFEVNCEGSSERWTFEAMIDTAGLTAEQCGPTISLAPAEGSTDTLFCQTDYYYRIGPPDLTANREADGQHQRAQIRQLFAMLGDRPTLDLYRPRRM